MIPGFVASWILGTCWPLAPCPKPTVYQVQQVQPPTPSVQIYYTNDSNNPGILEHRYQQVQNIGLSCEQKDITITYLEQLAGLQPTNPELLTIPQRRLNSAARTKIWQLRTYCH